MRRLLAAALAVLALGGAFVGGVTWERANSSNGGITEVEHDWLIDACVAEDLGRA